MKKIKAVIFDMDGVLIDAKDWHYEALNDALSLFGLSISRNDHLAMFDGLPTSMKLRMLSEDKGLPVKLHGFINKLKQEYTIEKIYLNCYPKFIHQYALSKLKSEGYAIAVASNSITETIALMMKRSGLIEYLDFFVSNQDVVKPKPDPEIYSLSISKLGLKPNECLVVEDNINGIKAAKSAGAHVLQVSSVDDVTYDRIMTEIERINRGIV